MQPTQQRQQQEQKEKFQEEASGINSEAPLKVIEIHQKALDDLVNVNSLFTIAVFVGLSLANPNQQSLDNRAECVGGTILAKRLVVYEVVSFGCFLLSSLVAKSLKIFLNIFYGTEKKGNFKTASIIRIPSTLLLSVCATVVGCIFLTSSMVDVIQIKVGKLSCGSVYSSRAAVSLICLVSLALSIYFPFMMYAIYQSTLYLHKEEKASSFERLVILHFALE